MTICTTESISTGELQLTLQGFLAEKGKNLCGEVWLALLQREEEY